MNQPNNSLLSPQIANTCTNSTNGKLYQRKESGTTRKVHQERNEQNEQRESQSFVSQSCSLTGLVQEQNINYTNDNSGKISAYLHVEESSISCESLVDFSDADTCTLVTSNDQLNSPTNTNYDNLQNQSKIREPRPLPTPSAYAQIHAYSYTQQDETQSNLSTEKAQGYIRLGNIISATNSDNNIVKYLHGNVNIVQKSSNSKTQIVQTDRFKENLQDKVLLEEDFENLEKELKDFENESETPEPDPYETRLTATLVKQATGVGNTFGHELGQFDRSESLEEYSRIGSKIEKRDFSQENLADITYTTDRTTATATSSKQITPVPKKRASLQISASAPEAHLKLSKSPSPVVPTTRRDERITNNDRFFNPKIPKNPFFISKHSNIPNTNKSNSPIKSSNHPLE